MADEEKTEAATPRRLQKAREEGQVAVSRELSMLLGLSAGVVALSAQMAAAESGVLHWFAASLQRGGYNGGETWRRAATEILLPVLPAGAAVVAVYAASTLLQTGFLLNPKALRPDISRISPLAGIKRLFGVQTLVQAIKAIAKIGVFGFCIWIVLRRALPFLPRAPFVPSGALYRHLIAQAVALVLMLLGVQAAIAGADLLWERTRHARRLRMSRHEQREEHKESEGNPQVKQRQRQLARTRARRRMMQAIPKAAVVITNPTHFAVALNYDRGSAAAPRVVAKGADETAARIRELAREHRVPIVANPPLAQALFRIEIDTEIPAEHFRAVAEIIAYIWRMRARRGRL